MSAAHARVQPRTRLPTSWTKGSTLTSVRASLVRAATLRAVVRLLGCQLALTVSGTDGFTYFLTQATVDAPCSQVAEILGSSLLCFRCSCGSGFCFPLPGVSCCCLVFRVFRCFLGSVERFRTS